MAVRRVLDTELDLRVVPEAGGVEAAPGVAVVVLTMESDVKVRALSAGALSTRRMGSGSLATDPRQAAAVGGASSPRRALEALGT